MDGQVCVPDDPKQRLLIVKYAGGCAPRALSEGGYAEGARREATRGSVASHGAAAFCVFMHCVVPPALHATWFAAAIQNGGAGIVGTATS